MITATGLGSGLDISGLVTQLVDAERQASDLQFDRKGAKLNTKFSALGTLKGNLSEFQTSLSGLNNLQTFGKFSATSSDEDELVVSANSTATANSYTIETSQLASAQSLASPSFDDRNASIAEGTITLKVGTTDYDSETDTYNSFSLNPDSNITTITIDSTNNTLEGLMTTINNADIGVNASIVNDGDGYRLLMTSEATGAENSFEITVDDSDGNNTDNSGLSMLAFNSQATNFEQTTGAVDAEFSVNGLNISSSKNQVDFAIPGVTLDLKTVTTAPIQVTVEADTSAVVDAVDAFVAGYNQLIDSVNELSAYDVEEDLPSALLGDFTLRSINNQIDRVLRNSIPGVDGDISSLSGLGIVTDSSGNLSVNKEALDAALAKSPDIVANIFTVGGASDNESIRFVGSSDKTQVGDYAINITAVASAGKLEGSSALPDFTNGESVTIDDSNNSFSLEVDGVSSGIITLTQGVYDSQEELAAEIQARINGNSNLSNAHVSVTLSYDANANSFTMNSDSFGKNSTVNMLTVDNTTTATLGFSVKDGTQGTDVAGTIGGKEANGDGKTLSAKVGSDAAGLILEINAESVGSYGSVNFTRGVADQLNVYFNQVLSADGALDSRLNTLESRINKIEESREAAEIKWEKVEARYLRQFNALDILLGELESTSEYMETQFENLVKPFTGN